MDATTAPTAPAAILNIAAEIIEELQPASASALAAFIAVAGGTFISAGPSPRSGAALVTFTGGTTVATEAVAAHGWNARLIVGTEDEPVLWTAMVSRRWDPEFVTADAVD